MTLMFIKDCSRSLCFQISKRLLPQSTKNGNYTNYKKKNVFTKSDAICLATCKPRKFTRIKIFLLQLLS